MKIDRKRKWWLKNKDKVNQRQNERNHSFEGKYKLYRIGAVKRGFTFDISLEEFKVLTTGDCHYCFSEAFGIDRIDSNLGYIDGNCVGCCTMCNRMKSNHTTEEFIEKCICIVSKHNGV